MIGARDGDEHSENGGERHQIPMVRKRAPPECGGRLETRHTWTPGAPALDYG